MTAAEAIAAVMVAALCGAIRLTRNTLRPHLGAVLADLAVRAAAVVLRRCAE